MSTSGSAEAKENSVVIIGAGMAGLSAAYRLKQAGIIKLVVLEASFRIGGRAWTVPFADDMVELGANWIHGGSSENPLFALAEKHALCEPLLIEDRASASFCESESLIAQPLSDKCYQIFHQLERQAANVFFQSPKPESSESLLDFLNARLNAALEKSFTEQERGRASLVFNSLRNYLQAHVGDDMHLLPVSIYGSYMDIEGPDVRLPLQGMQRLLQVISEPIQEHILLNHVVQKIQWDKKNPIVYCANGQTFAAKYVIVTVSLGVLKAANLFIPTLPSCKLEAIEKLGIGRVEKIFMEFEKVFWPSVGFKVTWSDEEMQSSAWYTCISSFDVVPNNPRVLATWLSGHKASLALALSDGQLRTELASLIAKIFPNSEVSPTNIIRTRWNEDPYIKGAYTYPNKRSEMVHFEQLSVPLPSEMDPRILWAGEASHPQYYSTLHGAYLSGLREAERILEHIKK